jgi:hypothetical protein
MNVKRPGFIDSEFVTLGEHGYELLPGAPEDVVREFEEYRRLQRRAEELEDGPATDPELRDHE